MTNLPLHQIRELFGGRKPSTSEIHEVSAWWLILRKKGITHKELSILDIRDLVKKSNNK